MSSSPWAPELLLEAARFAPDPDAARRLAVLPSWPEPGAYGLRLGSGRLRGFPFAFPVSSLQLSEIDEALAGAVRQAGEPPDRRGLPVPAPFWAAAG